MKIAALLVPLLLLFREQSSPKPRTAEDIRAEITVQNWDEGGDRSRWVYLHASEVFPAAVLHRSDPTRSLPVNLRPEIRNFVLDPRTNTTLAAWLPGSPLDGFIILHRGSIVFEQYPHMQASDFHLIFSITKAFVGTVLGILEDGKRIELDKPVEAYLPEFSATAWAGTTVRDLAEMRSGMEGVEDSAAAYLDPQHKQFQMEASLGWRAPTAEMPGSVKAEDTYGMLKTFRRVRKPGEQQAYTSANTLMLADMIEHVTGKRLGEVIDAEIWNKMGAENDALLLVNAKGIPIAHGGMVTTLRDLARFGLLVSQSTNSVLPPRFLNRLLEQPRPAPSEHNQQQATHHSSYQWDAVTPDGEILKGGFGDQLLYIDTRRDVVIAYFGTNSRPDSIPTRLPLRRLVAQYF